MSTRSDKFIGFVFKSEGFYSNDPADKGGETLYGISRVFHPEWSGWDIVDSYKEKTGFPKNMIGDTSLIALKNEFYKAMFYDTVRAEDIANELLALQVFDFGVTSSPARAVRYLQQVAGVAVDGVFGSGTLEAVNSSDLSDDYISARKAFYQQAADKSLSNFEKKIGRKATDKEKYGQTNYKFLKGWLNRVNNVTKFIKT